MFWIPALATVISLPALQCGSEHREIYSITDAWQRMTMTETLRMEDVTPVECARMCLSGNCAYFAVEGSSCVFLSAGQCKASLGEGIKVYGAHSRMYNNWTYYLFDNIRTHG